MARVLITGLSGAGKSTLLEALADRGYPAVDADYDDWTIAEGLWDTPRMRALLEKSPTIAVSGTFENQGETYDLFDHIVLLSAPVEVYLERVRLRTNNPYGKSPAHEEEIRAYTHEVEPRLRQGATLELDARRSIDELADALEALLRAD